MRQCCRCRDRTVKNLRYVAVRKLEGDGTVAHEPLIAFITKVLGRKLETAAASCDLLRAVCLSCKPLCCRDTRLKRASMHDEDWREFFCTELAAEGLQQELRRLTIENSPNDYGKLAE